MNPMAKKIPKTTIPLSFSSSTHQLNPNVAKKSDNKDMGKPFGKAPRRTFIRNGTPLPLTNWHSPKVNSSNHMKNVKTTALRSLEGRLAHVWYATVRLIHWPVSYRNYFSRLVLLTNGPCLEGTRES